MFKIGNSKELPAVPETLSREGKDFVRLCLQRDPCLRPTAAKLLEHPFVKDCPSVCRPDDTLAGADSLPIPRSVVSFSSSLRTVSCALLSSCSLIFLFELLVSASCLIF